MPQQTRRERKRQETFEEIVEVARARLNRGDDVSLRGVAADMGITSPGLYRYIGGAEALHSLVAGGILDDVLTRMERVRERYPDDPISQLAATASYFRSWALDTANEFQFVFATRYTLDPRGSTRPISSANQTIQFSSDRLSEFFGQIFIGLIALGLVKAPTSQELGPEIVAVIVESVTDAQRPLMDALGDRGPGTFWVLKLAWTRLYGVLTMEVFGQIEPAIIRSGLLFNALMRETAISLGIETQWDKLLEVAEATGVGS